MVSDATLMEIHALCDALGWLVFIPAGVWMSTVGRTSHPSKWRCLHGGLMLLATITIFVGAACAYKVVGFHFDTPHSILEGVLESFLTWQVSVGIWLFFRRGHACAYLVNVHRVMGMSLYLGGLVNGAMSVYLYSHVLLHQHAKDLLAMGLGFVAAVQLAVIWNAVPIWWSHLGRGDLSYEIIEDDVA